MDVSADVALLGSTVPSYYSKLQAQAQSRAGIGIDSLSLEHLLCSKRSDDITMRIRTIGALLTTLASLTTAIYQDEAYTIDYGYELIGLPVQETTFFHRPKKGEKASYLYTLSDVGVLGAINPGTGDIVWRQLLDETSGNWTGGSVRANGQDVITAVGSKVVAWDAMTGKQRWGNAFEGHAKDVEVMEGVGASTDGDVLVLFETAGGETVTKRLDASTGDVVWEHVEAGDIPAQVSTDVQSVFVISLQGKWGGYNVKVSVLDPVTGKKSDEIILSTKSDVHAVEDILFVGANSAAPIIAWAEKDLKSLKVNILGSKSVQSLALAATGEAIEKVTVHAPRAINSLPHFLVHSQAKAANWADVYHIDINSATISEAYHLPKLAGSGAFSTSEIDANVYFTRNTNEEVIVVGSTSHAILGRWTVDAGSIIGGLSHGVSEVVKTQTGYAVRTAVVTTDHDWKLVLNGAPAWSRPEGLSGAVAAVWAEISEAKSLVEALNVEAHSNPISAYVHRVSRHVNELQYLPGYLSTLPQKILSAVLPSNSASSSGLVRDHFGFHKLLILATERGRVYALDSGSNGRIVWSIKAFDIPAGEKWNVKAAVADNKKGIVTIRGSQGEYIILKAATGASIETVSRSSSSPIESIALVDSASGPWILPISSGGDPGSVLSARAPDGVVVVRGADGEVKGLTFSKKGEQSSASDIWSFYPPVGETILSVAARSPHDPVASIGKALADRTVLYKYLNPNLVLITTVSVTSSASFYLLDSSSGTILYSTTHPAVDITKPITMELSENTFYYSLYTDVPQSDVDSLPKGYQLVVNELYESPLANDRGPLGTMANYSTLNPMNEPSDDAHLPHVKSASFIIPEPISHMTTTATLQGITTKSLLLTLPNSGSIISIPRHYLDPRRPAGRPPTKQEQEEGLIPYAPNIEFDPKLVITHQRTVLGVRKVITSPALIESTSLVFAYGIDIFGTRVTPSGAFDVLGKGFNKLALLATVAGLAVLTGFMAPMVKRKQVNARWQT